MGFLNEEISSSTDSFQIHRIVQCCCVDECCSKVLIENEEIPCSLCDGNHIIKKEKSTTAHQEQTETKCQKNEKQRKIDKENYSLYNRYTGCLIGKKCTGCSIRKEKIYGVFNKKGKNVAVLFVIREQSKQHFKRK